MTMDVNSREAALWSETMKLKSEIEWLRAEFEDTCKVFDHYDLPEHAFHYRRKLAPELAGVKIVANPGIPDGSVVLMQDGKPVGMITTVTNKMPDADA